MDENKYLLEDEPVLGGEVMTQGSGGYKVVLHPFHQWPQEGSQLIQLLCVMITRYSNT